MLNNKVIVVTGGGGLIGRAFVKGILKNGGLAVVADVSLDAAVQLVEELKSSHPGKIEAAWLDITNLNSISNLIEGLQRRHGKIDAVINNAYPRNKNYGRKLEDVTYADFCENVNSHLGGYFLVAQQFCLAFKQQGFGNVINMSSIYGIMSPRFDIYDGTPMTMPVEYAAIKSAIVQLTSYFAQYFKGTGIRVNSLSPGGILAGQPDDFLKAYKGHCASKGMLAPDDVVGTLLFLLSDESRYINGQNLLVDDGFSI